MDSIDQENGNMFTQHIKEIFVFLGLLFALLLLFIYKTYFGNIIMPTMKSIKRDIVAIDKFAKGSLNKGGDRIDEALYDILKNKSKNNANGEYEKINTLVMKDINSGDTNKAEQKLLFFTMFSHLYDQIPDTNPDALKMIKYYFLKDPNDGSKLLLNTENDIQDLSYISLMLASNSNSEAPLIYKELDVFYSDDSNAKNVIANVDKTIKDLNSKIHNCSEIKDTTLLFAIYILILVIISIICMFGFNITIIKKENHEAQTKNSNRTLTPIANSINGILLWMVPPLSEIYYHMLDPQLVSMCNGIVNDEKSGAYSNIHQCVMDKMNVTSN